MQAWHRHRFRKRGFSLSDQAMESYLREDVPCGFPACNSCKSTRPHLPTDASHVVIPDHSVVGDYLEVFQLPDLRGVVYLTSCIKQVNTNGKARPALTTAFTIHAEHVNRCWTKAITVKEARSGNCIVISESNACCSMTHIASGLLGSRVKGEHGMHLTLDT